MITRLFLMTGFLLINIDLVYGAELIMKPNGVMLNCLADWESVESVTVFDQGRAMTINPSSDTATYTFEKNAFCSNGGYTLNYKDNQRSQSPGSFIDLSHLCFQDDADEFRFAYISDSQEFIEDYTKTMNYFNELMELYPDLRFILHGGDYTHKSTDESWKAYREKTMEITSQKLPILPVLGNHEYWEDPEISFYRKVFAEEHEDAYFKRFDFEHFVLMILDSNDDQRTDAERQVQDVWLEKNLKELSESNRKVIVAFHHPPFTSGIGVIFKPHNPDYVREHWVPLFEKYKVPLVLNAHEHVYERLVKDDVNYLVSGPAGGKRSPRGFKSQYSVKMIPRTRTITIISIRRDGEISYTTYSPGVGVIDNFKIEN